ncbi:unnamed protein product [Brassica rapa]|uniref:FKB95-like N-terminal Kelch domain-containing protein n=1 Tax=Brassica campestris TaxID=3711 RepID=A0A3P5YFT6_BRACM|nr:unnamed protein product [Brassica rapa]VDC61645.1 unnamed protein product [Brassica rapa]
MYSCLQWPGRSLPSWFTLWIKPEQTLTNELDQEDTKCSGTTMLVPIPCSYSPCVPTSYIGMAGSKHYDLIQYRISPVPSPLLVCDKGSAFTWREAPRMKLPRKNPVACILDGKIYVMGGCNADEATNWAEVFDPNTQTWESLPEPGPRLRSSLIKIIYPNEGKVYVSNSEKKRYFYDPKEMRWGVAAMTRKVERMCIIAGVLYAYGDENCFLWFDTKNEEWRVVKGLKVLCRNCCASALSVANYGGKMLVLWDKKQPNKWYNTNIWCSVVALERRNGDDDVWGIVEWASVVLTVPSAYVFLRCRVETE